MVRSLFSLFIFLFVLVFVEWYVLQALRQASGVFSPGLRKIIPIFLWSLTLSSVISVLLLFIPAVRDAGTLRNFLFSLIFINVLVKLFMTVFLFIDDLVRLVRWIVGQFTKSTPVADTPPVATNLPVIPRSEFLVKTAVIVGALPVIGMGYGIIVGAHDYRIRRITGRITIRWFDKRQAVNLNFLGLLVYIFLFWPFILCFPD